MTDRELLTWSKKERDQSIVTAFECETIAEENYWLGRTDAFREVVWRLRSSKAKDGKPKPKGGH